MAHTSSASTQCTPGRARRPTACTAARCARVEGALLRVLKEYSRGAQAVLEDTQRGLQEYSRGTLGLGPWAAIAIPQNVHGSRRTPTEPSRVLKEYSRSTQGVLKEYSHV